MTAKGSLPWKTYSQVMRVSISVQDQIWRPQTLTQPHYVYNVSKYTELYCIKEILLVLHCKAATVWLVGIASGLNICTSCEDK